MIKSKTQSNEQRINEEELDLGTELTAFFFGTDDNVDDAILKFIKYQETRHKKAGATTSSLENYFVYKTMILGRRRLYRRLQSLMKYKQIERIEKYGFIFYKTTKDN